MIVRRNLDQSVRIVSIDPGSIALKAQFRMQQVQVAVKTAGQLKPHLQMTAPPQPDPAVLMVTGSPEALETLAERDWRVDTEPVDLSRLQGSGQLFRQVILPPGVTLLDREDAMITINIGLNELNIKLRLEPVPVTVLAWDKNLQATITPPEAAIIIEGPPSALDQLRLEDFVIMPTKELKEISGKPQEVGVEARLKEGVNPDLARQVRILECQPPRIAVEFVPIDGHNAQESAGGDKEAAAPVKRDRKPEKN
jgi:YbbR domain-containing protein